jgi:hypothetical protein
MAYIGPEPNPGQNREVDDISSGFNGSTTAFTLQVNSQNVSPGSSNNIIVSLGGVVQNPGTDYNIAASTITFTTAPANGLSFFGLVLGQQVDIQSLADGTSPTMSAPSITGDLSIADKIVHTGDTNTAIRFPAADTITAETGGSERLRVDSSGRLLIGHTTSLAAANAEFSFQVLGTSFATTSVTQQRYAADVSGPSIILAKSRGSLGNHTIVNNGDELGKIRFYGSDGNDFNNYGAEIKAQCDGTPGNNDMPGRLVFSTTADGAASPTERMRIDSSGNILFGTTSVGGNTHAYFEAATQNRRILHIGCSTTGTSNVVIFRNPNNAVGSIQTSGSTTIYSTSSDYRLKENAVAISDGITRLKTLKPYRFNFKADADKTVDGFFAHEVTAVPEAISGTKDEVVTQAMIDAGDYKEGTLNDPIYQGIDQSKLVPLLVAAVQELITKVETLEAA